jgi:hypothetical protein
VTLRSVFAVSLLALALACSESTAPPPPCQGPIEISAGDVPLRFSWSPACGISALSVVEVADAPANERVVWGFTVSEQYPVGSAIRYGAPPDGASVWQAPESLDAGSTYRVTVMMTVGGDVMVASGSATFTYWPPD